MKNKKPKIALVVLGIVIVVGIFWYVTKSQETLSDVTMFELKSECANKAIEFAENRSKSEYSFTSQWTVLRSNYSKEKHSCFGEFMELVGRSDGSSFGEYWIFDLLGDEYVTGYTFEERDSDGVVNSNEGNLNYLDKARRDYESISKDIFGTAR